MLSSDIRVLQDTTSNGYYTIFINPDLTVDTDLTIYLISTKE